MGLDIFSSDEVKRFHIGYISFSIMRTFFILHYGRILYDEYFEIVEHFGICEDEIWFDLCSKVGDLSILLDHSDCDGELTSDECKKLKECLFIDEDKIKSLDYSSEEYRIRMIGLMYEFKDIVEYCADNDDIELIFG